MSKAPWIGAGAAAAAGLVIFAYATEPGDVEKLRKSLAEIEDSGRDGDAFSFLDELSRDLTFNGAPEVAKGEIGQWVRQGRPVIEFLRRVPQVEGERARLVTDVTVTADWMGMAQGLTFEQVELVWQKETAWKWAVLPVSAWRLAQVNGSGVQPSQYRTPL
jgi:hypothetical protein